MGFIRSGGGKNIFKFLFKKNVHDIKWTFHSIFVKHKISLHHTASKFFRNRKKTKTKKVRFVLVLIACVLSQSGKSGGFKVDNLFEYYADLRTTRQTQSFARGQPRCQGS